MNILIVAATPFEIAPTEEKKWQNIHFLSTGVGMVATTFELTKYLSRHPTDLVIHAGIAGGFDKNIPLGSVFQITTEYFSELGAEDHDDFLPIDALKLGKQEVKPIFPEKLLPHLPKIAQTKGITVNTVHGNAKSIAQIRKLFPEVGIESMESAAAIYVCTQLETPCLSIRSTSNYVEPRARGEWKIPLAIQNLNCLLTDILTRFQSLSI